MTHCIPKLMVESGWNTTSLLCFLGQVPSFYLKRIFLKWYSYSNFPGMQLGKSFCYRFFFLVPLLLSSFEKLKSACHSKIHDLVDLNVQWVESDTLCLWLERSNFNFQYWQIFPSKVGQRIESLTRSLCQIEDGLEWRGGLRGKLAFALSTLAWEKGLSLRKSGEWVP